VWDSVYAS